MQHASHHSKRPFTPLAEEPQTGTPQLTVVCNREAIIEGCAGVLHYDDTAVSLNCENVILTLSGFSLQLNQLSNGLLNVSGRLQNISFSEI